MGNVVVFVVTGVIKLGCANLVHKDKSEPKWIIWQIWANGDLGTHYNLKG